VTGGQKTAVQIRGDFRPRDWQVFGDLG